MFHLKLVINIYIVFVAGIPAPPAERLILAIISPAVNHLSGISSTGE
jgi:hypothetical protein